MPTQRDDQLNAGGKYEYTGRVPGEKVSPKFKFIGENLILLQTAKLNYSNVTTYLAKFWTRCKYSKTDA